METARYIAIRTLLDNGVNSLPLLSADIEEIISRQGFRIIAYNFPIGASDRADFEELNIFSIAQHYEAFTYADDERKLVFYRSDTSSQQRIRLLAHELGHIVLNHFSAYGVRCSSQLDTPQEQEANEFASELIAPTCVLKHLKIITPKQIAKYTLTDITTAEHIFFKIVTHTKNTALEEKLCAVFKKQQRINKLFKPAFIILLIAVLLLALPIKTQYTPLPQATDIPMEISDMVIVTRYGEKYHKSDCWHVKNRNVIEITTSEATEQGYEPCKNCF